MAQATTNTTANTTANTSAPSDDMVLQAIGFRIRIETSNRPEDSAACSAWRQADARHELAWQRLGNMDNTFHAIANRAPLLARETLLKTDSDRQLLSRRRALGVLGGSALTVGCAALLLNQQGYWQRINADYVTAIGERSQLQLAHQVQAWLNTDSAIAVNNSAQRLQVQLTRGEMLLATEAEGIRVVADIPEASIETQQGRFLVRREPNAAIVQIVSGSVLIQPRAANHRFSAQAGDLLRIDQHASRPLDGQFFDYSAWVDGLLAAYSMPLEALLAEVSRYRTGVLRCAPELRQMRVSGTYQLANPEMILQALARSVSARVRYRTRFWTEIIPA